MTKVELEIPDRVAREAAAAGLLNPRALSRLLREAVRRRAAADLVAVAKTPGKPMSMRAIQAEIESYRRAKRAASRKDK